MKSSHKPILSWGGTSTVPIAYNFGGGGGQDYNKIMVGSVASRVAAVKAKQEKSTDNVVRAMVNRGDSSQGGNKPILNQTSADNIPMQDYSKNSNRRRAAIFAAKGLQTLGAQ